MLCRLASSGTITSSYINSLRFQAENYSEKLFYVVIGNCRLNKNPQKKSFSICIGKDHDSKVLTLVNLTAENTAILADTVICIMRKCILIFYFFKLESGNPLF